MVTNVVRHLDFTDRETDGAVHWKSMRPKRRRAFRAQTSSDSDWLDDIYKGNNTTRFQYCKTSNDVLSYLRANSRAHTGGELIAPELKDHLASPLRWKEFLYHRGCSFNVTWILDARLIAGGKDRKEGRQKVFFTPLDPFGDDTGQELNNDSLRPRKVHFYSKWKLHQDVVYWIHLARAQEKGLRFLQTRSRAIILYDSVPADRIEKVVSLQGDRTLYQSVSTCDPELPSTFSLISNLLCASASFCRATFLHVTMLHSSARLFYCMCFFSNESLLVPVSVFSKNIHVLSCLYRFRVLHPALRKSN